MNPGESPAGVRVDARMVVEDWDELGTWLAEQTAEDQATLIVAMAREFRSWGTDKQPARALGCSQDASIASSVVVHHSLGLDDVCAWLEDLYGHMLLVRDARDWDSA